MHGCEYQHLLFSFDVASGMKFDHKRPHIYWFSMAGRKPERRLVAARSSDNEKRRVHEPVPSDEWLTALAARARFEAYSKHKLQPQAFGLQPFTGQREDATYCDGHANFAPADMARVPNLLRRGILAGLIGHNDRQGDPTLLWTVDDNGWIYEGRLTIPSQALYHGYPVLRTEAVARVVIARYIQYVYSRNIDALVRSAQEVQGRYS